MTGCLLVISILCASASASAKDIEVRFAAQATPARLGELVMVGEEARSDPFTLPVNHLTGHLKAPARVFRIEREDKKQALAVVKLPAVGSDFIILLVPGIDSVFEPVIIPARDGSFQPGDFYLHNVSRKPVLGQVGTTRFVIASRQGKVVRPRGAREGRFYDVTLAVREKPQPRVISSSRWPVSAHMRSYVFFFDHPGRQDVDFRAIDEFVPTADADGQAGEP